MARKGKGGRSYREALPAEKWAAVSLLLRSLAARRQCGRMEAGRFLREYRLSRMTGGPGAAGMIDDGGAELLLTAVGRLAREDIEAVYCRVAQLQKACAGGRLDRFLAANGLPLATEDERTALWWFEGRPGLPKGLAGMLAAINRYRRHCRHCCRLTRRGGDG